MKALLEWAKTIGAVLKEWQPALLVVEHTTVFRNMTTTKKLTYFEAVALIQGSEYGILCERVRTKQARKAVLGSGTFDKSDIQDWAFRKYNKTFGQDEAEAIVFALYGNTILKDG